MNILDFKEKLEDDSSFKEIFFSTSNLDELVDVAKEYGYNLDVEEIINDPELSDYLLEAVAGGKNDTYMELTTDPQRM